MADISKINPDGTEYNLKDATARTNIGNLASLHTTAKNDAVSAINEVKDEQANKADKDIVADAFSAAETYAEGDYCTYEGGLYKFKTAHEGAWSAADVVQVQVGDELSALNSTLTPQSVSFTAETGITVFESNLFKCRNIVTGTLWLIIPSDKLSKSTDLGVLNITLPVGKVRFIGTGTSSGNKDKIGHFMIFNGKLSVDNNYNLPAAGEYLMDITAPVV